MTDDSSPAGAASAGTGSEVLPLFEVRDSTKFEHAKDGRALIMEVGASDTRVPVAIVDYSRDGVEWVRLSAKPRAASIVRVCNAHNGLVKALIEAGEALEAAAEAICSWDQHDPSVAARANLAYRNICAALAKATAPVVEVEEQVRSEPKASEPFPEFSMRELVRAQEAGNPLPIPPAKDET